MVRGRNCRALCALGLLLWAVALKADEVRESDLGGVGDAFSQVERLSEWAQQMSGSHRPSVDQTAPPSGDFMIDFDGRPVEPKPLAPEHSFNPRIMGGYAKAEPKRDGMGGAPVVKFGDRKDVSLATIAQNNQAAAEAITQAAAPDAAFVMSTAFDSEPGSQEKTFEEKLELLSQKESPFSLQDYVEFRDFVTENESKVEALPNRDSRFHNNLQEVFGKFGNTDANRTAGQALRRFMGLEDSGAKNDKSKKRSGKAGQTH